MHKTHENQNPNKSQHREERESDMAAVMTDAQDPWKPKIFKS